MESSTTCLSLKIRCVVQSLWFTPLAFTLGKVDFPTFIEMILYIRDQDRVLGGQCYEKIFVDWFES